MARYKKDDKELASVTEIIPSPNLTFWRQKVQRECIVGNCYSEDFEVYMLDDKMLDMVFNAPKVISDQALEDGSEVHHMIEAFLTCGPIPKASNEQVQNSFDAFMDWFTENEDEIEVLAAEEKVYGKDWAGTLDLKLIFWGKQGVIDFKTSNKIYQPDYRIQTAAYRSVDPANEFNAVLRLPKDGKLLKDGKRYEYKDFSETYEKDLKTFYYLKDAYYAMRPKIAEKAGWEG
jgi:hypothetical protein